MRLIALLAAAVCAVAAGDIDPCKRQPFRGRCPSQNGATPSRSQFVLRYYMRDGECVSYPYGHCANDDSEPKLFRYKEECEDACIRGPGNLGSPKQTTKGQEAPVTTTLKAIEPTTVATEATTEKIETTEAVTKAQTTTQRPTTTAAPTTQAPTTLAPRTECERRRAFSGGLIKGGFIPTCTPNGEFEKMQCEPNGGQCFCVDNKGIEMPNSRMNGKPNCAGILSASVAVSSECTGAATPGPCSSNIDRWYYDESAQKCKSFKYSGCGGNGNNYPTEAGCNSRCAPPPQGAMRCEKGEPLKTLSGAPINCAKRECPSGYDCSVVQGSSVCCPQNEKTVGALETPINDVCAIPKERGPCDKYELRFYYNAEMKECKYFFWGGCDGNGNNFEKLEDCEAKCHVAKPSRNGGHVTQPLNPTQPQSTTVTRPTTTTQRPTTRAAPTTTPVHMPSHSVRPPAAAIPLGTVNIPDHSAIEGNRCLHPRDGGSCRGTFVRWFFNSQSGKCETFTYTGCAGNGNNFATEDECQGICGSAPVRAPLPAANNVCIHDVDAGECNGVFQRFAFDQESGECRPFTYGGCGGNGNNFASFAECENKCHGAKVVVTTTQAPVPPPVNICAHPVDKGPCNGLFSRFFFDGSVNECRQFTYGGCGGNGNNFASSSDCRRACQKALPVPQQNTNTQRPVQIPQRGSILPIPEARPACPLIDLEACVEPCIVFSNRKGCKECVCPVMENQPQPPRAAAPLSENNVARPPAPRAPQPPSPPSAPAFTPAPVVAQPPAPRRPVEQVPVPRAPETFQRPMQTFERPIETTARPVETFRRPVETVPTLELSHNKLQTPEQDKPVAPSPPAPSAPAPRQFVPQTVQQPLAPLNPSHVPSQLTEKCMQPVDAGPCNHFVDRWFFNVEDGACHPFKYGGCAGNRNHFFTQKECEIHCARFSRFVTSAPKAAGVPQQHITQFVNNVQYTPPNPPVRIAAFGKQNVEIDPIALTTLEALSSPSSFTEPHPPASSSSEEPREPAPPSTVSTVSVEPSTTTASSTVTAGATTLMEEISGNEIRSTTPASVITRAHRLDSTEHKATTTVTVPEEVSEKDDDVFAENKDNDNEESNEEDVSVQSSAETPLSTTTSAESESTTSGIPATTSVEPSTDSVEDTSDLSTTELVEDFTTEAATSTELATESTTKNAATEPSTTPSLPTTEEQDSEEEEELESVEQVAEKTTTPPYPKMKEVKIQPKRPQSVGIVGVPKSTEAPTTSIPTTAAPTTAAPTTAPSTTFESTTDVPSTSVPTITSAPTAQPSVEENNDDEEESEEAINNSEAPRRTPVHDVKETKEEAAHKSVSLEQQQESSEDYNTDDSIKKTQPTAVPTTQSTTTTQASTTTVKETTATVTFTTPVPVQPDGAGREPVPSVPVGIGRKAVELTLDDLDTPTETPSTSVPSTRATFAPKPEVFGPPHGAAQNNVHQLREEPFNAQIVCTQSPDAGRCTNYVPRWFFNVQTGQCEQFSYGSCGGNANNFMDRATCEVRCLSLHRPVNVLSRVPERCSLEKDSGFGRGYFAKWYFNMKNLRCEQFVYEGQRGNENQFDTLTDCERYCTPQPGTFFTKPAPTTTQKPPVQPVKQVEQEPIVKKDEIVPESPKVSLAPIAPTLAPQTTIVLDSDESTEPGIDKDEDEEEEDNFNSLSPIPSVAKSFEEKPIEQIQPQAPSSNQIPLASLENISPPATEPRPPAHAAKTEQVAAPQPIPNISGQNDPEPNKSYKAEPLPTGPAVDAHEGLPRVAPSPKETVNYQTGQHAQAKGLRTFGDDLQPIDIDSDNEFPDEEPEIKPLMPACPNGIQEMRYADGRPVMCLPGRNQCPDKSVCFFNGIDYFCCPNEEDPYDKHVFGGYEGEETRNGYKTFGPLRIQKLRHKRQASFNLDQIVMPLRFDAEKPKQFARAGAVMSSNRRRKQPSSTQAKEVLDAASANIAVCVQELAKGDCSEAHLRYFYDRDSDSCRLFYYSGCKGNGNNFGSLDDCQKTCVLGMKQTTMQQVQQTQQVKSIIPIENVPVGQCPGGMTPLGGPAPVLCGNNTDSIGCPSGYYCRAGPPDVCCPGQDPTKLSLAALISKDVRFAPQTGSSESTESSAEVATTTTVAPHKSFLDVPRFICPDASDPLLGKNGKPLMCGAGFDGMKMCPRGYYCAIDSEKGTRLCCALLAIGSRVPNEQVNAPYFGRRPANPGEVVERGSLPADQEDAKAHKHEDHAKPEFNTDEGSVEVTNDSVATSAQAEETTPEAEEEATTDDETVEESTESSNEEEEEEELPKLKMKPENPHAKLQEEAASVDPRVTKTEADEGVSMTVEDPKMPTVEEATPVKETMDRSICHLTPSEGRVCRDDERAPRTNLHYFYSAKDKRCKLYFYRGCGGNANRFEKKAACEAMCLNQA